MCKFRIEGNCSAFDSGLRKCYAPSADKLEHCGYFNIAIMYGIPLLVTKAALDAKLTQLEHTNKRCRFAHDPGSCGALKRICIFPEARSLFECGLLNLYRLTYPEGIEPGARETTEIAYRLAAAWRAK